MKVMILWVSAARLALVFGSPRASIRLVGPGHDRTEVNMNARDRNIDHVVRNRASARVLSKLGMREEGRLRQRVLKWNTFEDVLVWNIIRSEWPLNVADARSGCRVRA